jgi:hypothetical protein
MAVTAFAGAAGRGSDVLAQRSRGPSTILAPWPRFGDVLRAAVDTVHQTGWRLASDGPEITRPLDLLSEQ